ncbi:hypothetical protein D3C78_1827950 [compost metagenome]
MTRTFSRVDPILGAQALERLAQHRARNADGLRHAFLAGQALVRHIAAAGNQIHHLGMGMGAERGRDGVVWH